MVHANFYYFSRNQALIYFKLKIMIRRKELIRVPASVIILAICSNVVLNSCRNACKSWTPEITGYQILTPKPLPTPHLNGP